jgi:hypothetical protein
VQAIVSSIERVGQHDVTHHLAEIAIDKVEKATSSTPDTGRKHGRELVSHPRKTPAIGRDPTRAIPFAFTW